MKSLNAQKILITGVTGQVGFEILKSLSSSGAEIVLAVRNASKVAALGFPAVDLNLNDPLNIKAVLNAVKPSILINPAAYTLVDKAESEQDSAYAVNGNAVQIMAECMNALKGTMIHFSTDYIYNPPHENPNLETDAVNPCNVYASSKRAGELAIEESGVPYLNIRTSWVYGYQGNNFVKTMLRLGKERDKLHVVADQIGSPTSALTIAQFVSAVLSRYTQDPEAFIRQNQGTYNLSDSGYTNWHEFAQEIFKVARAIGLELNVTQVEPIVTSAYPTPAARPRNSRMSLSKIGDVFDFYPPTWQQSLRTFLYQASLPVFPKT